MNIIPQVYDWEKLKTWVRAARPPACLVMDDPARALQLKQEFPAMEVVHRGYDPRDQDWHIHYRDNPDAWLDMHQWAAGTGILVQVYNEPTGYQDLEPLVTWLCKLIVKANARNIHLCVVNFGVGHPDTARIAQLDPLLRMLSQYWWHRLGFHAYFHQNSANEPDWIDRPLWVLDRAASLGLTVRAICTEYGRDFAGGHADGWKTAFNNNQTLFFERALPGVRKYAERRIPTCFFCWGTGFGRWLDWDVQEADTLLTLLIGQMHLVSVAWREGKVLKIPADFVNLRSGASTRASIVGRLTPGQTVSFKEAGDWYEVEVLIPVKGFVSKQSGKVQLG